MVGGLDRLAVTAVDVDEQWLSRRIFEQRLQVFTERSISGAISSFIGTTLLAWIQYPVAGANMAVAWLALIFSVEFAIIGLGLWHQRKKTASESPATRAYTDFICALLLGLAWGSSVWFFQSDGSFFYYLLNLTVLATVTALTLTIVSPFSQSTWLFTFGILAPIWLHVWWVPNPFSLQIAVALLVLFLVQLHYAAQARKQLIDSLENALRNQFLAAKLRVNERQMLIAQAISNTGTWVYNPETQRLWGSGQALQIFGYPNEARELPLDAIESHLVDRAPVHQSLEALITTGKDYEIEYLVRPANGAPLRHVRSIAMLDQSSPDAAPMVLGFIQDVTKHKELEAKVSKLAFYDALTGLANRHLLADRLQHAMHTHARAQSYGALLFLDLDNFKPLNDRYGHSVGDQLLIQVGTRLRACVRQVDTVARFGGDEFVVVLVDVSPSESDTRAHAQSVAEKIRVTLAEPYQIDVGEAQTPVLHTCTASIGGAVFGASGSSTDALVQRADAAMYTAKERGRNQIAIVGP